MIRRPEGESELTYEDIGGRVMDLRHTAVPDALREHGIGSALVREAASYARRRGYRILPSCPFVARWLADHPEERDLVAGASEGR